MELTLLLDLTEVVQLHARPATTLHLDNLDKKSCFSNQLLWNLRAVPADAAVELAVLAMEVPGLGQVAVVRTAALVELRFSQPVWRNPPQQPLVPLLVVPMAELLAELLPVVAAVQVVVQVAVLAPLLGPSSERLPQLLSYLPSQGPWPRIAAAGAPQGAQHRRLQPAPVAATWVEKMRCLRGCCPVPEEILALLPVLFSAEEILAAA
mmetsp:Transcript_135555/g.260446  ORF Transcript_135555/g.260446 Transcript_135555/m.260446 type:complete len:208 (-) Transcript_135555:59-682(-)